MSELTIDPAETEHIVLVNDDWEPIGTAPKLESHHANTPLHLAFSVYIFRPDGKVLVTQRANTKKVWPGAWTNSCCGHPAPGESITDAIIRRVEYELSMTLTDAHVVLPKYQYKTPPFKGVVEHEACPLYFAKTTDQPKPNPLEVDAYKWLSWEEFTTQALNDSNDAWSWWCKDQLKQLLAIPNISNK